MNKGGSRNAEQYLDDQDIDVKREYGSSYDDLDKHTQKEAILDIFFQGLPKYNHSAERLRDGIANLKTEKEKPERHVRAHRTYHREQGRTAKEKPHYQRVERKGRGYMFRRNRFGRFTR